MFIFIYIYILESTEKKGKIQTSDVQCQITKLNFYDAPIHSQTRVNRVAQIYLRHAHNRNTPKSLRTMVDGASPATQNRVGHLAITPGCHETRVTARFCASSNHNCLNRKKNVLKISHAHKKKRNGDPLERGCHLFSLGLFTPSSPLGGEKTINDQRGK